MPAIRHTHGRTLAHLIECKINLTQDACVVWGISHLLNNRLGDRTRIEWRHTVARQSPQALSIGCIAMQLPCCQSPTAWKEIALRDRITRQAFGIGRHHGRKPWRNDKTIFGKRNSPRKQASPRAAPPAPMCLLHQSWRARNPDRTPPDNSIKELQRFAFGILKQSGPRLQWGRLASIKGRDLTSLCVKPKQKRSTTKTRALRLNKPQNSLYSNHRIGSGSTFGKNSRASLGRIWVCCRNHPALCSRGCT